jgi:2-dehydro-3-deoxy-D-gluconate 5-dehydrogenase
VFNLAGRHIVVTGAGRGLGRGIAAAVVGAGARTTLVARSVEQLEGTARLTGHDSSCSLLAVDLASPSEVERLAEAVSADRPPDGVVHCAGIQLRKSALDFTLADWRSIQAVNVEAPVFLSTALARRQVDAGQPASHVFIASLSSSIGLPNAVAYAAGKSAVLGIVRTLAVEWASAAIRVNAIGPGYFETQLTADLLSQPGQRARILSRIPMGRLGNPDDLGGAAVFLLSDASAYVTGQVINVDGGWLAN